MAVLPWLRRIVFAHVVVAVLGATVLITVPSAERYGDNLQIALPVLGLACSAKTGSAGEYLVRFGALLVTAHGSKAALGSKAISRRPNGGDAGFPSAHAAAATFGASELIRTCLAASPAVQAIVVFAAAFTGLSRLTAAKHDIWQVLAGGVLGHVANRVLRRPSRARAAAQAALGRLIRRLRLPSWRTRGRDARRFRGR